MVTRKRKPPRYPEELIWLVAYVFALVGVLIKHNGKLPPAGSTHLAADLADESVMHFYERFPK